MKKIINLRNVAIMIACLAASSAFAQDCDYSGTTGDLQWCLIDGTLTISGEGAMPDYYDMPGSGNEVAPWYDYSESIYTVIIEQGVTTIGDHAFHRHGLYQNLTSVTIPNSVTSIGWASFGICWSLPSITIPEGVTTIKNEAFMWCFDMTSVIIPSSVTSIWGFAFGNCESLSLITNLNSVPVEIDEGVFSGVNKSACTLQVPMCAVSAYENAPVWQDFNIVGIDTAYMVFLVPTPQEGGEVVGGGYYSCGDIATVEAIPHPNYVFVCWIEKNVMISIDPIFTIVVTENRTLIAVFAGETYGITLLSNPPEAGEVIGGGTFAYGDVVTVSGVPNDEYEFINWLEDGIEISTGFEYTFTVTGARTLTGNFETYDIVIQSNSPYGIVFGGGNYRPGIEVTVLATVAKADNYEFVNWTKDGIEVSTDAEYTFITAIGDMELVANFEETNLGIGEINSEIDVYPNPTTGELIIENGEWRINSVEILDLMGRRIATVETQCIASLQQPTSTTTINISHLPTGMYFIQIQTESGMVVRKVVKD